MTRATKVHVCALRLADTATIDSHSASGRWDWRTEHLDWYFSGLCGTPAARHMLTTRDVFWDVPAAARCRRCAFQVLIEQVRYRDRIAGHELHRPVLPSAEVMLARRWAADEVRDRERAAIVELALHLIAHGTNDDAMVARDAVLEDDLERARRVVEGCVVQNWTDRLQTAHAGWNARRDDRRREHHIPLELPQTYPTGT